MHLKEDRIVVVTRVILDEENDRKRISGKSTTSFHGMHHVVLRQSLAPPCPLLRVLSLAAAAKRLLLVGGSLVRQTPRQAACNPYSQPSRDIRFEEYFWPLLDRALELLRAPRTAKRCGYTIYSVQG
jgi:hypothetical protein